MGEQTGGFALVALRASGRVTKALLPPLNASCAQLESTRPKLEFHLMIYARTIAIQASGLMNLVLPLMTNANYVHLENGRTKMVLLLTYFANFARLGNTRLPLAFIWMLSATKTALQGNGPTSLVSPLTLSADFVPSAGTQRKLEHLRVQFAFCAHMVHPMLERATSYATLASFPQISPPTSAWWTSPVDLLSPSSVKFHEIRPVCQAIRLM